MLDSDLNITSKKFNQIEIYWENITVTATVKQKKLRYFPCFSQTSTKVILDQCTGIAKPGTFTAIMGPSGILIMPLD